MDFFGVLILTAGSLVFGSFLYFVLFAFTRLEPSGRV